MTFKEKLAMEHPESIDDLFMGGCCNCPGNYGYSEYSSINCGKLSTDKNCTECWNREMPNTDKKEEKSMKTKPRNRNEAPTLLEGNYNLIIKGNEMVLVDNVTGEVANARCHGDDEFFVCNGIDIAFTHLLEKKYGNNYQRLTEAFNNVYREDD